MLVVAIGGLAVTVSDNDFRNLFPWTSRAPQLSLVLRRILCQIGHDPNKS